MEKGIIKTYESIAVLSTKLSEEEIAAVREKFKALIEGNGTLDAVDEWGKRRLAYEINDETEGFFIMFTFSTGDMTFVSELERVYRITDGILRSLTVNKV